MNMELSRRERQVMEIVYNLGKATVADVLRALPDRVSDGTVRTFLRRLEEKELLRRCRIGREHVYHPVQSRACAGQSAIRHVLDIFYDGSLEKALACHLADPATKLNPNQRAHLIRMLRDPNGVPGSYDEQTNNMQRDTECPLVDCVQRDVDSSDIPGDDPGGSCHTESLDARDATMLCYAAIHADHGLSHDRQSPLLVGVI